MNRIIGTYETNGYVTEYSVIGDGTPVMVMHGGHSNCYEEFGYQSLLNHGYKIITPSRAGYGLSASAPLHEACHRYVELLNYLQVDRVHLIGVSAGGPSAIKLAGLFPERVQTVTLQSAVTGEWLKAKDKEFKAAHVLFRPSTERFTWRMIAAFSNVFSPFLFKQMFSSFSTLPYHEAKPLIRKEDIEAVRKMNNRQRSGTGFLKDITEATVINETDLASIQCPVFIQASENDKAVPKAHAYFAQKHIFSATMAFYNTWGHLIWLGEGSEEVNEDLITFLQAANESSVSL